MRKQKLTKGDCIIYMYIFKIVTKMGSIIIIGYRIDYNGGRGSGRLTSYSPSPPPPPWYPHNGCDSQSQTSQKDVKTRPVLPADQEHLAQDILVRSSLVRL